MEVVVVEHRIRNEGVETDFIGCAAEAIQIAAISVPAQIGCITLLHINVVDFEVQSLS